MENCFNTYKRNIIITSLREENSKDLSLLFSSVRPSTAFENGSSIFEKHRRLRKAYVINETSFYNKNNPTESVTIIVSSVEIFVEVLENIKDSIWWNHEAKFLIINKDSKNSCNRAYAFLKTVWTFNILSVVYLCRTQNDRLMLYTFNPYSKSVPKVWNEVRGGARTDEYWTLLEHPIERFYGYFYLDCKYTNYSNILN